MKYLFASTALLLILGACSSDAPDGPTTSSSGNTTEPAATSSAAVSSAAVPSPHPRGETSSPPTDVSLAINILTLEGLGALRIGQPVPVGSGWAERGAQMSDECRTVSSPDFRGVYAIVEGSKVRRITIGERSDVKLAGGIGTGTPEATVRGAFPSLREEPHHYVDRPAKYLTTLPAARGGSGLRFEIGADGKVGLVHVGTMPVLSYVEGCA